LADAVRGAEAAAPAERAGRAGTLDPERRYPPGRPPGARWAPEARGLPRRPPRLLRRFDRQGGGGIAADLGGLLEIHPGPLRRAPQRRGGRGAPYGFEQAHRRGAGAGDGGSEHAGERLTGTAGVSRARQILILLPLFFHLLLTLS